MNFKLILLAISMIIQLSMCHPTSNGSSFCTYYYQNKTSVDCRGHILYNEICDHLMEDLDNFGTATFENCEISERSNIFKIFPNISQLMFLNNNTLSSANFSQADHLTLFVMENGNFKTTPTSFSMNGANLEMFQFNGNQSNKIDYFSLGNPTKLELFSVANITLPHLPADFFKNSTNLTFVNLEFNQIERIDSMEWPNSVKWISFISNKIAKLSKNSFRNLTNLEILELNKNKIGEIEDDAFFELRKLLFLNMDENNIKKLTPKTFAGLCSLKHLYLQDNQIETIEADAFHNTPELWDLTLNRNNISSLHQHAFGGPKELHALDLSENPINKIDIDAFSDLSRIFLLNMSSGELETIDFTIFAKIFDLDTLILSNNKISQLKRMTPNSIPNEIIVSKPEDLLFPHSFGSTGYHKWLKPLQIKAECLGETKLKMLGFLSSEDVFRDLERMFPEVFEEKISLGYYNTTGHRLHILDLSGNQLTVIEKNIFADFRVLKGLNLANNPITTLYPESFSGLNELYHLRMDHCALTAIDFSWFDHLDKLNMLDLSHNQLLTITAATFPSLQYFSLSGNRLSSIPLKRENVPKLYEFNVSNNKNLNCSTLDEFVKIKLYCESDDRTFLTLLNMGSW